MRLRLTFTLVMGIGALVGLWGWLFVNFTPIDGVPGQNIQSFYDSEFVLSIFIAAVVGFLWAFARTRKSVLHEPGETGQDFTSRVLVHGLKGMGVTAAIALLVACFEAGGFDPQFSESSIEQVQELVFHHKSIAILCIVAPTMGLIWGFVLRTFGDWGGSRALFGSSKGGS